MQMKKFLKNYWEYMAAFLIPIVIVLIHCFTRDSWLLGNGSILLGDAGVQYVYIFEELWNKVHSGNFSFFSWNAVGGFDFYLNMLYYAISPATIIALILPKNYLEDVLQVMMVLKWALLSFSAVYFFMHTKFNTLKENKRFVSLALGLCYALSNFFIGMLPFFNWHDTLILFPFLLLQVEKMIENGKWKAYYILLTVAMICNCYIAFPVCIFIFLWFLLNLQGTKRSKKKIILRFLGSSILAVISSLFVILPSVLNLITRYSSENDVNIKDYIKQIIVMPNEIINRFFILSPFSLGEDSNFSFYCSLGVIALIFLFCFIKMKRNIKYIKLGIVVFIIFSIIFGCLSYIWHAFSIPHGCSPRFGFALLMILLIMALDVLCNLEQIKVWNCIIAAIIGIGLFCYAFFNTTVFEEFYVYLVTLLLFVLYIIFLVLLCRKSIKTKTFVILFLSVCMVELCGNAYFQFSEFNLVKPEEMKCNKETADLAELVRLEKGQRVVFAQAGENIGLKTGMPTMSGFISYANGKIGMLHDKLGLGALLDSGLSYVGGTPLIDMIFNISGGIGKFKAEFNDCTLVKEGEELNIYQKNQVAGFGFMVENSVDKWGDYIASPFEYQNLFVKLSTSEKEKDLFTSFIPKDLKCSTALLELNQIEGLKEENVFAYQYAAAFESDGNILSFIADKDMNLYFTTTTSVEMQIIVGVDEEVVYNNTKKTPQTTISLGKIKKGQKVSVFYSVENQIGNTVQIAGQFAEWNEDVWNSVYKELSDEVYQIEKFESDYVSGAIEAKKDGIMMTSVPAMKGFTVYVDGEQTEYKEIGGALIGVPLKAGKHVVEFKYRTPYAALGFLISVLAIGVFTIICIRGRKKNVSVFCEE